MTTIVTTAESRVRQEEDKRCAVAKGVLSRLEATRNILKTAAQQAEESELNIALVNRIANPTDDEAEF